MVRELAQTENPNRKLRMTKFLCQLETGIVPPTTEREATTEIGTKSATYSVIENPLPLLYNQKTKVFRYMGELL